MGLCCSQKNTSKQSKKSPPKRPDKDEYKKTSNQDESPEHQLPDGQTLITNESSTNLVEKRKGSESKSDYEQKQTAESHKNHHKRKKDKKQKKKNHHQYQLLISHEIKLKIV